MYAKVESTRAHTHTHTHTHTHGVCSSVLIHRIWDDGLSGSLPSFQKRFLGDLRWVARFGLMSQIGASQIEALIGSLFQKYVSSTFMVKMRIDLGS